MARGGAEALAAVPLFGGLSRRHLKNVAELVREESFEEGATLAEQGEPGETFYVILEGAAKVTRGKRTINRLLPGDFFGEIALIDGGPRTASVISETPMTTLTLPRSEFQKVLKQEPSIVVAMLEELARRLRSNERSLTG